MDTHEGAFRGADHRSSAIRDLHLKIEGSALEPILAEFRAELESTGIVRVIPRFYLSTEWGVPDGTIAIGIPFYLAHPELVNLQAELVGYVEGVGRSEILRYLRHEMGHVVNYAYQIYESSEWSEMFGRMSEPYVEEYRPEPFSRRFVRHLPGWYAQKHPDEDWAETFAVWMTPGLDWKREYAEWPVALAKLQYCDQLMASLASTEPIVTSEDLDEDVGDIRYSINDHYRSLEVGLDGPLPEVDGSLRAIFEDLGHPEHSPTNSPRRPASRLILEIESELTMTVYRWTGCFPERVRPLIRHLADRADQLDQVYPLDREIAAVLSVTTLISVLAMNQVTRGSFLV